MLTQIAFKIKKHETPFYNYLFRIIKKTRRVSFPSIKSIHLPLYYLHCLIRDIGKILYMRLWAVPIFKAKCEQCGIGLKVLYVLWVSNNHLKFYIRDNVTLLNVFFESGLISMSPIIKIGNRVNIGKRTSFSINERVEIGDDTTISWDCFIADSDGHPVSPQKRLNHESISKEEIYPVIIGKNVWIGAGCRILKGVTIGDNSIIGANSVVTRNVPPNTIFAGVPAKNIKDIYET